MVGHTFLYNAAVRHVKDLLDSGQLGQLYYVYSQRLNLGQVRTDVNAWWNLAPHDVSILLYLMDGQLPVSVSARGVDYIQPGIEDVVFATLTWASRVCAHIQVSWLDPGKVRRMTLVGSRKMVVYDDISDDKIAVLDKGVDRVPKAGERMDYDQFTNYQLLHRTGDVLLPRIDFQEPLKVEAIHFLDCIRTGQTPHLGPQARPRCGGRAGGGPGLSAAGRTNRGHSSGGRLAATPAHESQDEPAGYRRHLPGCRLGRPLPVDPFVIVGYPARGKQRRRDGHLHRRRGHAALPHRHLLRQPHRRRVSRPATAPWSARTTRSATT